MLLNIYWGLFVSGVVITVLSLVLNGTSDGLNFDLSIGDIALPIKPFFLLLFSTVFGGAGIVGSMFFADWLVLTPSAIVAFVIVYPLDKLLTVHLRKYESFVPHDQEAIGTKATVVETISPGTLGKITYNLGGNTVTGIATLGQTESVGIKKGEEVYILRIENNICSVGREMYCKDVKLTEHSFQTTEGESPRLFKK